jgi:predicted metal-dependent peptidase
MLFIYLHELWHLFSNHVQRGKSMGMDHKLMNFAADMIINETIIGSVKEHSCGVPEKMYQIPSCGILRMNPKYTGAWQLEPLYEFLAKEVSLGNCPVCGKKHSKDGKGCCPFGKSESGETLDKHMESEDSEAAEAIRRKVQDIVDGLKAKGHVPGDLEKTIERLSKPKHNYLKHIRKVVAQIRGLTNKEKTIKRESRREIIGTKGKIKTGQSLTVLLDTSGSMWGMFEKVLSQVNRDGLAIDLIKCDAQISGVERITSRRELAKVKIAGGGGTELMPGIRYAAEHFKGKSLVILSDGMCDDLDFSELPGKHLFITCQVAPRITGGTCTVIKID